MAKARTGRKIAIALLLAWTSFAFAQKQSPKPKLALQIRTNKPTCRMTEGLKLDLEFVNLGSDSILLFRQLGSGVGRLNLRVFDERGNEVVPQFLADELPPPPRDKSDFERIGKNERFRTQLSDSFQNVLNRPGVYDLVVEYTSTIGEDWARRYLRLPVKQLWTRECRTTVSNRIRITLTN